MINNYKQWKNQRALQGQERQHITGKHNNQKSQRISIKNLKVKNQGKKYKYRSQGVSPPGNIGNRFCMGRMNYEHEAGGKGNKGAAQHYVQEPEHKKAGGYMQNYVRQMIADDVKFPEGII